jgi:hypothetical protein
MAKQTLTREARIKRAFPGITDSELEAKLFDLPTVQTRAFGYVIVYSPTKYHYNGGKAMLALDGKIWDTKREAQTFNKQAGTRGQIVKVFR